MNKQGKKYVIISREEYETLKGNNCEKTGDNIFNPVKDDLHRSEKEMTNILNKSDVSIDEKVQQFTKELNNFKRR